MTSGYDYCLNSSQGDSLTVSFEPFSYYYDAKNYIYQSAFYIAGTVSTLGFSGYFSGSSNLTELKQFLSGIEESLKRDGGRQQLPIFRDEGALWGFPQPEQADHLAIEIFDAYRAGVSGNIRSSAGREQAYAQLQFQFDLDIELLKDSLWDLRTIHQILDELYQSTRRPDPTTAQRLLYRAHEYYRRLRWLLRFNR